MPSRRTVRERTTGLRDIENTIGTLDAKLKLLAQRLKIIEMNEQVIGRTLVSHNKKLKELESSAPSLPVNIKQELKTELLNELKEELKKITPENQGELAISTKQLAEIQAELKELRKTVVNLKQQVDELKYTLESINPLEYVTLDELSEVIDKKISNALAGKKL